MDCTEFLSSYTDFRDGLLEPDERTRMDAHRRECASCRRYERVVEKGVGTLRALPRLSVPADFRGRLQHRIYHVEDGDVLSPTTGSSGASPVAILGIALLLTVAAWSPSLRHSRPEVQLSPIVVNERPIPQAHPGLAASSLFGESPSLTGARDADEIWRGATLLLLEYSPLRHPARSIQTSQDGLE